MHLFNSVEELTFKYSGPAPCPDSDNPACGGLKKGSVVTIGNFDGVHLGHQALIKIVLNKAAELGLCSAAVTFNPHPLQVLIGPQAPPMINSSALRMEYLAALGLDYTLLLEFTRELASLEPEDFVRRYLVEACAMRHMVVGYDYSFGRGRRGNFELLSELGKKYGFGVDQASPVMLDGEVVSSTRIREYIGEGGVAEAARLMGRFYALEGEVVHGFKRGAALLGFPTANIQLDNPLLPKCGVYACFAKIADNMLPAVANIGYNPHFGNDKLSLECHILDFSADLYGQTLRVSFVRRLRDEKKFSSIEALIARIKADVAESRPLLSSAESLLTL